MSLGLSQSNLERIISITANRIVARGGSRDKTEVLADAVQHALRDVAKAITANNKRIAEQLVNAGIVIT